MIADVLLRQGGADKNYVNDNDQKSILEIAIDYRNFKAIDYLINQAQVRVNEVKLEKDYGFTL